MLLGYVFTVAFIALLEDTLPTYEKEEFAIKQPHTSCVYHMS